MVRPLDAMVRTDKAPFRQFPNTAEGAAALAAFCREHGIAIAVMEATGGYEHRAFAQLRNELASPTCRISQSLFPHGRGRKD